MAGLDKETLDAARAALDEFVSRRLGDEKLLAFDARDECPAETVRAMCGAELGIHLFFVAEEWGGMGGGAVDLHRICERMACTDPPWPGQGR